MDDTVADPMTLQHIIKRTNTQKSIPSKLLGRASYEAEAGGDDRDSPSEQVPNRGNGVTHQRSFREKK